MGVFSGVQPLDKYKTLKQFYSDVEKSHFHPFPLKVMGKSRANEEFTASMMSIIYQDTGAPDQVGTFPVQACFGSIHKKGCRIDLHAAYSTISTEADGTIHLYQGDVVPLQLCQFNGLIPKHTYSMILSHSCEIDRACSVQLAPVFLESELTQQTMEFLKNDKVKNLAVTVANWLNNESSKYIGFPACDVLNSSPDPDNDDRFLVPFALNTSVAPNKIDVDPVVRLKYRCLAYLQWRMAIFSGRDVQRSDETREF